MKVDRTGRVYCEIRDPSGHGPVVRVPGVVYDVMKRVTEDKLTCSIDFNFNAGSLGNSHIKIASEKFAGGPVTPMGSTLPAG